MALGFTAVSDRAISAQTPGNQAVIALAGNAATVSAGIIAPMLVPPGVAITGRTPQFWDRLVIAPQMKIFGEPAVYMPARGGSFSVTAVFTDAYLREMMFDEGPGVTEMSAILGVQLTQFPAAPLQGDKAFVPSVNSTYVVREVRNDGCGAAKLMLSLVSYP